MPLPNYTPTQQQQHMWTFCSQRAIFFPLKWLGRNEGTSWKKVQRREGGVGGISVSPLQLSWYLLSGFDAAPLDRADRGHSSYEQGTLQHTRPPVTCLIRTRRHGYGHLIMRFSSWHVKPKNARVKKLRRASARLSGVFFCTSGAPRCDRCALMSAHASLGPTRSLLHLHLNTLKNLNGSIQRSAKNARQFNSDPLTLTWFLCSVWKEFKSRADQQIQVWQKDHKEEAAPTEAFTRISRCILLLEMREKDFISRGMWLISEQLFTKCIPVVPNAETDVSFECFGWSTARPGGFFFFLGSPRSPKPSRSRPSCRRHHSAPAAWCRAGKRANGPALLHRTSKCCSI